MRNFKRDNRSDRRKNSEGFSGRDSRRPTMHKVICTECGKDCEVPFKPTGDKPVFCSDCFSRKRNVEPRRFSGKDSGRFSSGDRRMHEAICDNCGKKCEVPFKPTSDKPIYCNQCFSDKDKDKTSNQTSKQFETIDAKLDKILKALNPPISAEVDEKKETIKKTKTSKSKKVSKSKDKKVVSPKKAKGKKKK
jgi:CxxC-x17-CxxC domain-containing protein